MANLTAILDAAGATLGRRRQDDDLPRRHRRTSRPSTPSTRGSWRTRRRPARPSAWPRCRRAPASRSRSSHACRAESRSVDTPNGAPIRCRHPTDDIRPTRAGTTWRRERPPSSDPGPSAPLLVNPPDTDATRAVAVVLAAGLGTRMRSSLPKVLHPLCGRPMLAYVLDAWASTADGDAGRPTVVYSPPVAAVTTVFADQAGFALQEEPRGTGDAVRAALDAVPDEAAEIVVVYGDVPLVTGADFDAVLEARREDDAAIALASVFAADPGPARSRRARRVRDGRADRGGEGRDARGARDQRDRTPGCTPSMGPGCAVASPASSRRPRPASCT